MCNGLIRVGNYYRWGIVIPRLLLRHHVLGCCGTEQEVRRWCAGAVQEQCRSCAGAMGLGAASPRFSAARSSWTLATQSGQVDRDGASPATRSCGAATWKEAAADVTARSSSARAAAIGLLPDLVASRKLCPVLCVTYMSESDQSNLVQGVRRGDPWFACVSCFCGSSPV